MTELTDTFVKFTTAGGWMLDETIEPITLEDTPLNTLKNLEIPSDAISVQFLKAHPHYQGEYDPISRNIYLGGEIIDRDQAETSYADANLAPQMDKAGTQYAIKVDAPKQLFQGLEKGDIRVDENLNQTWPAVEHEDCSPV